MKYIQYQFNHNCGSQISRNARQWGEMHYVSKEESQTNLCVILKLNT